MPRTLIVASTYERARDYARKHNYTGVDIVGGDIHQLRGRHAARVIIVGELDEYTEIALAPVMVRAEVLHAT